MNAQKIVAHSQPTFSTWEAYGQSRPRCPYCNARLKAGKHHFINWDDGRSECIGSEEWTEYQQSIPEIIITRHNGAWCYRMGGHYLFVCDENRQPFPETVDPMDVAKSINARTAGPINVIWI